MKRGADLLKRLSDTVGKMLLPMLSTSHPICAKKKAQEAAAGIRNAIASLQSATLAIERWKTSRPEPGSNHPGAIVWEMQLVAKEIFRDTRKRPTKRKIRWELEQDGWGIKSKDAEARWAERFRHAGLADLPEWALLGFIGLPRTLGQTRGSFFRDPWKLISEDIGTRENVPYVLHASFHRGCH